MHSVSSLALPPAGWVGVHHEIAFDSKNEIHFQRRLQESDHIQTVRGYKTRPMVTHAARQVESHRITPVESNTRKSHENHPFNQFYDKTT